MSAPTQQPTSVTLLGASALVTGASSGIGREVARELARKGVARLVLVARREAELAQLRAELERPGLVVQVRPTDLADEAATTALAQRMAADRLDVVCLGAGFGDLALFDEADWDKVRRMVQVNVTSAMQLVHAVLPGMVERGSGALMVITSGAGHSAMARFAAYSTTKHALAGFCENLRLDLAGTGVSVTEVAPGPVPTGFDAAAGVDDSLNSMVPDVVVIDAAQCAREAVAGLERGEALVWPGRVFRALMTVSGLLPRQVQRWLFAAAGRKALQNAPRRTR